MDWSIAIGPLAIPVQLLVFFAAVGCGMALGERAARKAGLHVTSLLNTALCIALLVARVAFVVQYRHAYTEDFWRIIDIRDGGWSPWAGLAAAWFYVVTATATHKHKLLRRPALLALGVASAIWVGGSAAVLLKSPALQGLPSLQTLDMNGTTVDLSHPTGQPMVVNLWATWCAPCKREMPVFEQAQTDLPNVRFVLVNQGETPEVIARFLRTNGLKLDNVLLDPKADVMRQYGASGLPLTLFFNPQGQLVSSRVGEVSAASLQHHIKALQ